jgi:membrane protease YdiL (CAAX protease family)
MDGHSNDSTEEHLALGHYFVGSDTSLFSISDVHVGLWALAATIGLGLLAIIPGALVQNWVTQAIGMERSMAMPWLILYASHVVQLLVALLLIGWLGKGRFAGYGLRWPQGKSYVMAAVAWGIFFGVLMTVVDYFPHLRARTVPENLPLTAVNLVGWLSFEGIFVGFSEEIPFRGLLQTFLMKRTAGRIRFLKFDMHVAGVILALLFALAHATNFWQQPFWAAAGQQAYALALGILYAYWYEKSGSLLAAILGHNMSDLVEYALLFLLVRLWG